LHDAHPQTGHKPAKPHPKPKIAEPTINFESIFGLGALANFSTNNGLSYLYTSGKVIILVKIAPIIMNNSEGSQVFILRVRKSYTFEGLHMPESIKPAPNIHPST
jgi:hypothetical protein